MKLESTSPTPAPHPSSDRHESAPDRASAIQADYAPGEDERPSMHLTDGRDGRSRETCPPSQVAEYTKNMHARVQFQPPGGQPVWVGPGAVLGRLATAEVHIPDPRVSEAHALVSIRDRRLVLLALRRKLRIKGETRDRIELGVGDEIELAPGVELGVLDIALPSSLVAIRVDGADPVALSKPVYHLFTTSSGVALAPGFSHGAAGHIWAAGTSWWLKLGMRQVVQLEPSDVFELGGSRLSVESSALSDLSVPATVNSPGARTVAFQVYKNYVVLECEGVRARFAGRPGAVLVTLRKYDEGMPWDQLAREVWTSEERTTLRQNWDRVIYRIRRKLREVGIPDHVLVGDGSGNFQLVLE